MCDAVDSSRQLSTVEYLIQAGANTNAQCDVRDRSFGHEMQFYLARLWFGPISFKCSFYVPCL